MRQNHTALITNIRPRSHGNSCKPMPRCQMTAMHLQRQAQKSPTSHQLDLVVLPRISIVMRTCQEHQHKTPTMSVMTPQAVMLVQSTLRKTVGIRRIRTVEIRYTTTMEIPPLTIPPTYCKPRYFASTTTMSRSRLTQSLHPVLATRDFCRVPNLHQ